MQTNNSSQCQLFQLHIDAFLDRELEPARLAELQTHMGQCESCSRELAYAQELHRAVAGLPILDCPDAALEPIDRLFHAGGRAVETKSDHLYEKGGVGKESSISALLALFHSLPAPLRIGVTAAATMLLVIGAGWSLLVPGSNPELAGQPSDRAAQSQYTQAEVTKALQDLELALDYLEQISARTEVMIEDRFLLRQLEDTINASLTTDPRNQRQSSRGGGPI